MRTLPRRRYIYRDPDTGREFMCWRGEALDRVVRHLCTPPGLRLIEEGLAYSTKVRSIIAAQWRRNVRLRAPLAR